MDNGYVLQIHNGIYSAIKKNEMFSKIDKSVKYST
jgi:sulfur transfer complex TusBCD TusB component (DsrH family)